MFSKTVVQLETSSWIEKAVCSDRVSADGTVVASTVVR